MIKLNEIKSIENLETDGIQINTQNNDCYRFTSFSDRDTTINILQTTRQKVSSQRRILHDREWNEYPLSSTSRTKSLVRTLSDSLLESNEDEESYPTNSMVKKERRKAEKALHAMAEFSALSLSMRESLAVESKDGGILDINKVPLSESVSEDIQSSWEALKKKSLNSNSNHVIQVSKFILSLKTY